MSESGHVPGSAPLNELAPYPHKPRVAAFDGLRGLFAALVVLSHLAAVVYNPSDPQAAPSGLTTLLWYLGAPSVDAFFVLSGWVVANSLRRRTSMKAFYLARIRRLLPLGLIGALLGLLLARPLAAQLAPELVGGFLPFLRQPLRVQDVLGVLSLGLFGHYDANRLNPPLWSLATEVYASVLMPLLLIHRAGHWLVAAAGGTATAALPQRVRATAGLPAAVSPRGAAGPAPPSRTQAAAHSIDGAGRGDPLLAASGPDQRRVLPLDQWRRRGPAAAGGVSPETALAGAPDPAMAGEPEATPCTSRIFRCC